MKKIILIISFLFLLTGCNTINLKKLDIVDTAKTVINSDTNLYNINNIGYRYYLPRGFKVIKKDDYNEIIYTRRNKFYLFVDVVSYYNKVTDNYKFNEANYLSETFNHNSKVGYLSINKKNDKFFVEMVYNYAKIEVVVDKESEIKENVANMGYILSSIIFNDSVIKNTLLENKLKFEEQKFEIKRPKKPTNKKNFLEVYKEYDNYKGVMEDLKDSDNIINKE